MKLMTYDKAKQEKHIKQSRPLIQTLILPLMVLALSGCTGTTRSASVAFPPPEFDPNAPREPITQVMIEPASGMATGDVQPGFSEGIPPEVLALKRQARPSSCRVQDRFDRKQVVAYEWAGRNRLGLDVDGVGFNSFDVDQVKLQYRLRFQPHKTKKERCRYTSKWQGLVGSGYNEFFLREDDTVWKELKTIRHDTEDRWQTLFQ